MNDELKVKVKIELDNSNAAKKRFQDAVQEIANSTKGKPPKIAVAIDTKAIQTQLDGVFKATAQKIMAPTMDLNPLKNQYKQLEQMAAELATQNRKASEQEQRAPQATGGDEGSVIDYNSAIETLIDNTRNAVVFEEGLIDANGRVNASASLAAVGMKLLNAAVNSLLMFAVETAIKFIVEAIDTLIVTEQEHLEQLAQKKDAYASVTNELVALQSELVKTKDRIAELQSSGKLTLYEQEELDKLIATNDELERQNKLLEIDQNVKQSQKTTEFVETFRADIHKNTEFMNSDNVYTPKNEQQYIEEQFTSYEKRKATIERLENERSSTADTAIQNRLDNQIEAEKKALAVTETYLLERKGKFETEADGMEYIKSPSTDDEKASNEALDFINDFYDKLAISILGDEYEPIALKRIIDKDEFSDIKEELDSLAQRGQLTADVFNDASYDKFIEAMVSSGVIANSTSEEVSTLIDTFSSLSKITDEAPNILSPEIFNNTLDKLSEQSKGMDVAKSDMSEYGVITSSTLSSIAQSFPTLKSSIVEYQLGLIKASDIIERMKSLHGDDYEAFKTSVVNKLYANAEFNNTLLNNEQGKLAEFARSYGIDLLNYKTLEAAKVDVQKAAFSKMSSNLKKYYGELSIPDLKLELREMVARNGSGKYNDDIANLKTVISEYESLGKKFDNVTFEGLGFNPKTFDPDNRHIPDKKSTSDNTASRLDKFNKELADLQYQRDMDKISAEQYYSALAGLRDKYFTKNGSVLSEYLNEYRQYNQEIYQGGTELFNNRLKFSQDWIDDRNTFDDWDKFQYIDKTDNTPVQDNEIAAWDRVAAWMQTEYYEKGLISHEVYLENLRTITRKKLDLVQAEYEKQLKDREALLKKQQDGLNEIIDLTVALIKKEKQDMIDALQDEIDKRSAIIDAQKESLQLTERELSYQDEVNDKIKDISKLQSEADALGLDNSREAQAKRADLLEQIAEKQDELNAYQHDEAVTKAEEALDTEEKLFKEEKEKEIREIESYLKQSGLLVQAAMDRIDNDGDALYQNLLEYNSVYGSGIETEITSAWEVATAAVKEYGDALSAVTDIDTKIKDIEKESNNSSPGNITAESRKRTIQQMIANGKDWGAADALRKKELEAANQKLGNQIGAHYNSNTGTWWTDKTETVRLYHNGLAGGFVGNQSTPKQNEVFALLTKGEVVLNQNDQFRIGEKLKLFDSIMSSVRLPEIKIPALSRGAAAVNIDLKVDAPISIAGNVDDSTIYKMNQYRHNLLNDVSSEIQSALGLKGIHTNIRGNIVKS